MLEVHKHAFAPPPMPHSRLLREDSIKSGEGGSRGGGSDRGGGGGSDSGRVVAVRQHRSITAMERVIDF